MLAHERGQFAAVCEAGITPRSERSIAVPHKPPSGQDVDVLAEREFAELAFEARLCFAAGLRVAELAAEDDPRGHETTHQRGS
jgi:hypothetical protein